MGTQAIPDFSDLKYNKPAEPAPKPDQIPDFSDLKYGNAARSPNPIELLIAATSDPATRYMLERAPGVGKMLSGVADIGVDLGAMMAGPLEQSIIGQFSPSLVRDIQKRRDSIDKQASAAGSAIGHGIMTPSSWPSGFGQLAKGLLYTMPGDFAKFVTGLDPSSSVVWEEGGIKMHLKELTQDELDDATHQTAANALAFYLGGIGTSAAADAFTGLRPYLGGKGLKAFKAALSDAEREEILVGSGMSRQRLLDLNRKSGTALNGMPWAQTTLSGIIGGSSAGVVYGYASAPEDQRVQAAITMGIIAMPLGLVHAGVSEAFRIAKGGSVVDVGESARELAFRLQDTRAFNDFNRSPMETLTNLDILQQVKDVQSAAARKLVTYDQVGYDANGVAIMNGKGGGIVPGVEAASIPDVLAQLEPRPGQADVMPIIRVRPDGFHDILITSTDTPVDVQEFFKNTGYVKGQQVTYGGSERWVIEDAVKGKGRAGYKLTLRNMVTEEFKPDVTINDVIRPSNKYIGEYALYQSRQISPDELFDPSLGIALKDNNFTKGDVSNNQELYNGFEVTGIAGAAGYQLDNIQHPTKFVSRYPTRAVDEPMEIPLKPGINDIKYGSQHGVFYLASDGNISGAFDYLETPFPEGGSVKRVSNAWHFQNTTHDIRAETAIAVNKYRTVDNHIVLSNSTLSPFAQPRTLMRANLLRIGRQYTTFGEYNTQAFLQDMTTDFLNDIGFFDGDIHPDPKEVISRIALKRKGASTGPIIPAKGETLGTAARRRTGLLDLEGEGIGYVTEAESARITASRQKAGTVRVPAGEEPVLTREQEARAKIATEIAAGSVPEVTTSRMAVPTEPRPELSFNESIESWMDRVGFRKAVRPAVRTHIEMTFGRILTGQSDLLVKINKETANIWRARINDIDRASVLVDKLSTVNDLNERASIINEAHQLLGLEGTATTAGVTDVIKDAKRTRNILEARVTQLETPMKLELEPGEIARVKELKTQAAAAREENAHDLFGTAYANDMYVDRDPSGTITIRDMDTHIKYPVAFHDEASALQWVKDTGGVKGGRELDGGAQSNQVSPESVGGGIAPPGVQDGPMFAEPHDFHKDNWFGKFNAYVATEWPRIFSKRAVFIAWDTKLHTDFYEKVYQPTQAARQIAQAAKMPFQELIKGVEDKLKVTKLSRGEWARIDHYRNTMSVQDIDNHPFEGRLPTDAEKEMSQRMATMNIDAPTVYKYIKAKADLAKNARLAKARLDPNDLTSQQKAQEIDKQLQLDNAGLETDLNMDTDHLSAAQMFEFAQKQDRNTFRLDVAVRRARSLLSKEKSRSDFAEFHKMTKQEIEAADALDAIHAQLRGQAGASDDLQHYINHQLVNGEPVVLGKNAESTHSTAASLAEKLVGSGQIGPRQYDPILNAVNMVSKLVDHVHFDPAWDRAITAAKDNLKLMEKIEARDYAKGLVNEYLYGIKGAPNAHDQYSRAMLKAHLADLRNQSDISAGTIKKKVEAFEDQILDDASSILLSATSSAFLGGRPAQGARDLQGFLRNYYTRVGATRTLDAWRLAFKRNPETGRLPIYELAEQGKVPGLSFLAFLSEQEVAEAMAGGGTNHTVRDAIYKAGKFGLVTSGQHNVYALAHAMAYLETSKFTNGVLLDLSRGKITRPEAYAKLKMDTYDIPVARGFDNLVMGGKYSEATEYLAQATGTETAFVYGMQNHPYGWGSKAGRLLGQFGQFATFERENLTRVASRGTATQKAAAIARYAVSETALYAFGAATGVNVLSWYGLTGIVFAGSPLWGMADQITDMAGLRGKQRQQAALRIHAGKIPIISNFIPGNSALSDYIQSYDLAQKRYGPIPIGAKALGFPIDRSQRSWIDELSNQWPQVR